MTHPTPFVVPKPQSTEPEFTKILREAGIEQSDAHKYLFVREWCQRNRGRCWIPESVLEAMNLDVGRWS